MALLSFSLLFLHSAYSLTTTTYNYFAFGSNLVPETMTALRNLQPISATAAILPNYRLRFSIKGAPLLEPSAAAVEYYPGKRVHGVLYMLSEQDFATVGSTEGVPFGYRWQECMTHPYIGDGQKAGMEALEAEAVKSYTLIATSPSEEDIPPSKSYLGLLIKGARQFGMDLEYQKELEATPVAQNLLLPNGLAGDALRLAQFRKRFLSK